MLLSPALFVIVLTTTIINWLSLLSSHIVPINKIDQLCYWLFSGNVSIQNNLVLNLTKRNYVLYNMTFCLIENVINITYKEDSLTKNHQLNF